MFFAPLLKPLTTTLYLVLKTQESTYPFLLLQNVQELSDLGHYFQKKSGSIGTLRSWDMASISYNPQENRSISWKEPEEDRGPTMVRLRQQWEGSAAHKAVLVFDSSSRANLTMIRAAASNATTSTRKDDLRLRPYQSRLEATSRPTEETLVRQPVRVLDDGKHQTGRKANTRQGPKWMEEADVNLYAEQCPAGDLSQSKSTGQKI